jgi:DNA-directed RNA polymerase alpha subunit
LTNQIKCSQSITKAWEILDNEFNNKRKLMDEILKDITNIKPVRSDAKSLACFAAKILSFANNMEQNRCSVTDSAEPPFIMSRKRNGSRT